MFGKILIVLLMLTSLIPTIALSGSNLRYLPAFNVLLMTAVYALFCLKDRENREHLWAYCKGNKYILFAVILYIMAIWISSYKTGLKDNLAFVGGISLVLVVMHFLLPVIVQKREDMAFVIKTFFVIGLLNVLLSVEFWVLYKLGKSSYGIYGEKLLSDKFDFLQQYSLIVLRGIFENQNSLGILISSILPAILFLLQEEKHTAKKLYFMLYICFFVFIIVSSFSRSSVLSMLVVIVSFCALYFKVMFNILKTLLLFVILTVIFFLLKGSDLNFLKKLLSSSSSNMRVDLWNKGIEIIQNNLFYGYGPSKVIKLLGGYASHNTFIEIALGFGVIALSLYSVYLITTLLRIKWHEDRNLSIYTLLTFSSFSVLQLFETLQFGGLSIANFYFLTIIVSYLSVTSSAYPKRH